MLPELLTLKNFLSYKEEQKLDFRNFHIALLSGENGQGKSSVLDAITFVLFSKARGVEGNKKGMEDLVSAGKSNLKVIFQFNQNNNRYRITRMYDKIKGKSDVLLEIEDNNRFINISGNRIRETDEKIARIIGMDYDAFVTSSFILQGKSDFFTAKNPGEKMEILREMLGLNIYEEAREKALNKRREKKVLKEELLREIENTKVLLKNKGMIEKNLQSEKEEVQVLQNEKTKCEKKHRELLNLLNEMEKLKKRRDYLTERSKEFEEHIKAKKADVIKEEGKLSEIKQILEKRDEIVQGYNEYIKDTSLYNDLLKKKVEVSQLRGRKENIEIRISKEIALEESKQKELRNKINESKTFVENALSELKEERTKKGSLFKKKDTLEKEEKILLDKVSLLKGKAESLSKLLREKINTESEVKKLQEIRNERLRNAKKNKMQWEKELVQIKNILNSITLEETEKKVSSLDISIQHFREKIENERNKLAGLNEKKALLVNQIKMTEKAFKDVKEKSRMFAQGTDKCPLCGSFLTEEHKQKVQLAYKRDIQEKETLLDENNTNLLILSKEISHIDIGSMEEKLKKLQREREHCLKELHNKETMLQEKTKQKNEILSHLKKIELDLKEGVLIPQEKAALKKFGEKLLHFEGVEAEKERNKTLLEESELKLQKLQKELGKVSSFYAVSENKIKRLEKDTVEYTKRIKQCKIEMQKIEELLNNPEFLVTERKQILQIEKTLERIHFDEEAFKQCEEGVNKFRRFEALFLKLREAEAHREEVEKHILSLKDELEHFKENLKKSLREVNSVSDAIEKMGNTKEQYDASEKALKEVYEEYQNKRDTMIRLEEECKKLEEAESALKEKLNEEKNIEKEEHILDICVDMFGKGGIQSLIIRSVLPQIEDISNDILRRMSGGTMQLKFNTVKTTSKGEERSTLEIDVYDNGARRRYALFSGGEQFRINLAVRIGISLFLASLSGKPLEMLIIDEGFGSQDESGRVRVLEELDSIKDQFKKILIITHITEVKESFPYELRVTKDKRGSHIYVV